MSVYLTVAALDARMYEVLFVQSDLIYSMNSECRSARIAPELDFASESSGTPSICHEDPAQHYMATHAAE